MSQKSKTHHFARGMRDTLSAVFTDGGGRKLLGRLEALTEEAAEISLRLAGREAVKRKKGKERIVRYIAVGIGAAALFALSLIISLSPFSLSEPYCIYPAAIALVSAAGMWERAGANGERDTILSGAMSVLMTSASLISCFIMERGGLVYFLVILAVFLARAAMSGGRMDESLPVRMAVSAMGSAVTAAAVFFSYEGVPLKDVIALCFFTPMLTFLFSGFGRVLEDTEEREDVIFDKNIHIAASVGAVLFAFLQSIRDVRVLLFSLPLVAGTLVTTAAAKTGGPLYGCIAGFVSGLAQSPYLMEEYGTMISAALGISGLFAGIFFERNETLALMCSFATASAYSLFTGGIHGFGSLAADHLAGLIIFIFISRFIPQGTSKRIRLSPSAEYIGETVGEGGETARSEKARYDMKLRRLSDAFQSLSNEFRSVSECAKRPGISRTSHIVSSVTGRICSDCSLSGVCWGNEHSTTEDVTMKLALRLLEGGEVTEEDVPEYFRQRCVKLTHIIGEINARYTVLCAKCFKENGAAAIASEYSTVSRLLKGTADEMNMSGMRNEKAERRSEGVLRQLGISHKGVSSYGARGMVIDIAAVAPESLEVSGEDIRRGFERAFGGLFEEPQFILAGEGRIMRMKRKRVITLGCAHASCAKSSETVNGDTTGFFENDEDRFYALICDGMGSGREAALTSRLAAIFIERLLTCTGERAIALEMLNDLLLAKGEESFTTVDLFEADLIKGEASFIKAGAASSYIVREGRLYKISSHTPPAGIIRRLTAEQTRMTIKDGDIIVMVSDGVSGEGDKDIWLPELLVSFSPSDEPSAIARRILNEAKVRRGGEDDMTVSVIRAESAR